MGLLGLQEADGVAGVDVVGGSWVVDEGSVVGDNATGLVPSSAFWQKAQFQGKSVRAKDTREILSPQHLVSQEGFAVEMYIPLSILNLSEPP